VKEFVQYLNEDKVGLPVGFFELGIFKKKLFTIFRAFLEMNGYRYYKGMQRCIELIAEGIYYKKYDISDDATDIEDIETIWW
jgi:hypothetical protein